MSPQPIQAARRSAPARTRSHEELYEAVEAASAAIEDLRGVLDSAVEGLKDLAKVIGSEEENEHGEIVLTGIVGKLARLQIKVDDRFSQFDGWIKMGLGFSVATGIFGPAIWWLVADNLAHIFK